MRDKRNKIIIFVMLVCIFITSLPINAFALEFEPKQSTYALTNRTYDLILDSKQADNYTIKYYHPAEYTEVFILRISTNSYTIYWAEEGGQYYCNDNGYGKISTASARIANLTLEKVYEILFEGKTTSATFQTANANAAEIHGTKNRMFVYSTELLNFNQGSNHIKNSLVEDHMTFDKFYSEWYFDQNGIYPQPDVESSDFMKGNYYAILSQAIETKDMTGGGGGTSFDDGLHVLNKSGKTETVEDVELTAKDGTFIYVVISTEKPKNHVIATNVITDIWDGISDIILGQWIREYQKVVDIINEDKNTYELRNERYPHLNRNIFFYSEEEKINRYYFDSLTNASKFVLYGTAGATPQHIEEGKTTYGFGYSEVMYNNYDLEGYPAATVPIDKYPIGKTKTILRWHEENVYEREYLLINYDYFPASSAVATDNVLRISPKLNPTYYVAYKTEENEDTFDPQDYSLYEETDKYDIHKTENFLIYFEGMETDEEYKIYVTESWDIIWTDHNTSKFKESYDKDGNLIVSWEGVFDEELATEKGTDAEGNKYIINNENNTIYKDGEIDDGYKYNKDTGLYENSKGETIDKDDITWSNEEWKETLKDYTSSLENAAIIIEDFTDFINNTTKEISQLTALFNAYLNNMPRVFKNLIIFTIISFILMRILRRE